MERIEVRTKRRCEMVDITERVDAAVRRMGIATGVAVLQCLHTTASLTINENADPDVERDVVAKMDGLVPEREPFYTHAEGNSDSHVKTSLFGPSLVVLVEEGRLLLGQWQGVYLCEWDGPRNRRIALTVLRSG